MAQQKKVKKGFHHHVKKVYNKHHAKLKELDQKFLQWIHGAEISLVLVLFVIAGFSLAVGLVSFLDTTTVQEVRIEGKGGQLEGTEMEFTDGKVDDPSQVRIYERGVQPESAVMEFVDGKVDDPSQVRLEAQGGQVEGTEMELVGSLLDEIMVTLPGGLIGSLQQVEVENLGTFADMNVTLNGSQPGRAGDAQIVSVTSPLVADVIVTLNGSQPMRLGDAQVLLMPGKVDDKKVRLQGSVRMPMSDMELFY